MLVIIVRSNLASKRGLGHVAVAAVFAVVVVVVVVAVGVVVVVVIVPTSQESLAVGRMWNWLIHDREQIRGSNSRQCCLLVIGRVVAALR